MEFNPKDPNKHIKKNTRIFNQKEFGKWLVIGLEILLLYAIAVTALWVFNEAHHRSVAHGTITIDAPDATAKR